MSTGRCSLPGRPHDDRRPRRPVLIGLAFGALTVFIAFVAFAAFPADAGATGVPLGARAVAASADECAVWRREQSFAASVEAHDAAAFAGHLHPGAVFNAGAAAATRGRAAVEADWKEIVEGKALLLRWRAGIVQIGGEASVALSKGPYILETQRDGKPSFRVGFFQSVWVRNAEGRWLALYDALASTPQPTADRATAETWVAAQPMSDCG